MAAAAHDIDTDEPRLDIACPVLVTERLLLRKPHASDVPDLAVLAGNRRVADMLARMPHPYGEEEARAFVVYAARPGSGCTYAVTLAESGLFIGAAGLNAAGPGVLELGYWIGEPHWGHGYATEAAHALVDLAFRASQTQALSASCRVVNPGSRRVLHKCGFQYDGQGMLTSLAAGQVPVERYRLDRRTWIGLRDWPRNG